MKPYKLRKICFDCKDSVVHQTGSQIWLSCKFQSGWRDTGAYCNLDGQTVLTKESVEVKV